MTVLLPKNPTRRSLLRGTCNGAAVAVALPFLNCFLNGNGTAIAATGAPLPVRFGTWYWGLGHTPGHAVKEQVATVKGIEFLEECEALKPYREHVNFFSGFNTPLDGRGNYTHYSGFCASRTGTAAAFSGDIPAPTLDIIVADEIGAKSRFLTLNVTSVGIPRENYSARSTNSRGAAEASPINLYTRLFGPGFVDPNNADFKPDPATMIRHSVLSSVAEERTKLVASLGAEDRARLDHYFTSIRQVENQLALELQKPPPNAACMVPARPADADPERHADAMEIGTVQATHNTMSRMLAMAIACDQTRVFNMVYSDNFSHVRRPGEATHHHQLTHEEVLDQALGYQPGAFYFGQMSMAGLASYIQTFIDVKEGDGNLLDNVLVMASTETNYARTHSIDGQPMFLFGRAGGRVKTGYHVVGSGDPVTRVGFTALRAMGVPLESWGTKSLRTARVVSEILV